MPIADISFTELTGLLPLPSADALARLAACGVTIPNREENWLPLAGEREYLRAESDPITVDGVRCKLLMELSRASDGSDAPWFETLELYPAERDDSGWAGSIRRALGESFELAAMNTDGIEIYQRDEAEALLFPATDDRAAYLLIHLRPMLRG